jgi:hypothetical protein
LNGQLAADHGARFVPTRVFSEHLVPKGDDGVFVCFEIGGNEE